MVIHNAGHLLVGYVEAYTAEEIAHLIDVNTLGVQRLNRAVLPYLRERGRGTLLYIGSTTSVTTPPFLGPYVVSKAAMDSLALVTSYEGRSSASKPSSSCPAPSPRAPTTSPKPVTPPTSPASPTATGSWTRWSPVTKRPPPACSPRARRRSRRRRRGDHPNPRPPVRPTPFRSVVDLTNSGDHAVQTVNQVAQDAREKFVTRLGYGELLHLKH